MIIFWQSNTCECLLSTTTFDDNGLIMEQPCVKHKIKVGNHIWYNLKPIMWHLLKQGHALDIRDKYHVKIISVKNLYISRCFTSSKRLIQIEWKHEGKLNINMLDGLKQIYYSEMNDEPMYKMKDEKTLILTLLYQAYHHTIDDTWIPTDKYEFGKDDEYFDFEENNCNNID